MDLLYAFNDFITKEKLFSSGDPLLVAVSGGLDSTVLCELCYRSGFDFALAHCNFRLRGVESQRDEDFVRGLAVRYDRPLHVRTFDTAAYAAEFKLSVQVAARELRYAWFRELMKNSAPAGGPSADSPAEPMRDHPAGFRAVLTAHHLDDNIETLLMNFFKGTGIAGLRAMLPRQGEVVRPLLFAERSALQQFASESGLQWVEDSSNLSDKYTRNHFRHQVIPLIQQVYPSALQNLAENIDRFRDIEFIYRQTIEQQRKKLLVQRGNEWMVPVLQLKRSAPLHTLVYELIRPFGFSPQQTGAVTALLDSGSGKYVCSATHRVLKDRSWLIISPLQTVESGNIVIEAGDRQIVYERGELRLELLPVKDAGVLPLTGNLPPAAIPAAGAHIALLDAADIQYPLLLRKWRQGDYFYPLGMRKKKKIARFLIDNKLSLADKEKVWVLEMDKKIIWVVGKRIDDRWRIGPGTKDVLKIEWRPA